MTIWKAFAAALALSTVVAAATPASAQGWFWGQQEPAAFQAMYPNRDVLNGGELTPAGRMGLVRAYGAAPVYPYAGYAPYLPHRHHLR
ncbi:conserved exported hypothetical protein [Bradyrhizobium sp. STM 3843]|uniref:hypothetical protein n=1 Tax=Bradyrhizobium sp. STM 3843 TaxID=551947 RepID=UPI0002407C49|nr:hypothetical protein [Bradyrhizobium sp. STM 3843]CCE07526.1 conserved exported hypothetical protein [Bradyrhizobium sp. STM 3843]